MYSQSFISFVSSCLTQWHNGIGTQNSKWCNHISFYSSWRDTLHGQVWGRGHWCSGLENSFSPLSWTLPLCSYLKSTISYRPFLPLCKLMSWRLWTIGSPDGSPGDLWCLLTAGQLPQDSGLPQEFQLLPLSGMFRSISCFYAVRVDPLWQLDS